MDLFKEEKNIHSRNMARYYYQNIYNPTFNLFEESFMSWYINKEAAFPDRGVESDNKEMEGCCCK